LPAIVDHPSAAAPCASSAGADLSGKYLTFALGDEEFGVAVLKVREIIGVQDITKVPQTVGFVEGVINLRGKVIPVIDLRSQFGLPRVTYNKETCIIVVDVGDLMGIIVDTVREVHDIPARAIEPPPTVSTDGREAFLLGMAKVKDEVKILLDIDQVLKSERLVESGEAEA
jgi:purine-binding chemotaxis protein CheW